MKINAVNSHHLNNEKKGLKKNEHKYVTHYDKNVYIFDKRKFDQAKRKKCRSNQQRARNNGRDRILVFFSLVFQ